MIRQFTRIAFVLALFVARPAQAADGQHDWNLGPTGLRGSMHCDKLVTTGAREISITEVKTGSPADGIFLVGDTLLGVGGRPFSFDPRTEFGRAITEAESQAGGGKLVAVHVSHGTTAGKRF